MKTIYKKLLYAIAIFPLLALTFQSCTENADMTFQTNYLGLVVEGEITTDTTVHTVILRKSGDPLNNTPAQFISNAVVTITNGSETISLLENSADPKKKGHYETLPNVYGVPGKIYTLNISNIDVNGDGVMETYTASSALKPENPIDSISFYSQNISSDFRGTSINLFSKDIGGGRQYYLIKAFKNDTLITDSIHECGIASNSGFEGQYYNGISVYFLNYNRLDERVKPGNIITLELDCITEDYYNFIDGYIKEYQPKNPVFSGPSSNISTNIISSNPAVGFFAAYSINRKSAVYKGQ